MNKLIILFVSIISILGCSKISKDGEVLKSYSIENSDGLLVQSNIEMDTQNFAEGKASLKISVDAPGTIPLYQIGDIDVEDAALVYRAQIKTENLQGQVYLEMWCSFGAKGNYFSRGIDNSLAGTNDWKTLSTTSSLNSGENPENVKLNLVVAGIGTVWIDDIKLIKK